MEAVRRGGSAPSTLAKGGPPLEPVNWGDTERGGNTDVATASVTPSLPVPPWMGIRRGVPLCRVQGQSPWSTTP